MEEKLLADLTNWLKETKGITKIDIFTLAGYLPEYQNWLDKNEFHAWLDKFVKTLGDSSGMGSYVDLHTGETLYIATDEYKEWYHSKYKEYKTKKNE